MYNEALYGRLEKDVYYLRDDQESLRQKMQLMEKRITDMEEQIGCDSWYSDIDLNDSLINLLFKLLLIHHQQYLAPKFLYFVLLYLSQKPLKL